MLFVCKVVKLGQSNLGTLCFNAVVFKDGLINFVRPIFTLSLLGFQGWSTLSKIGKLGSFQNLQRNFSLSLFVREILERFDAERGRIKQI